MSRDNPRIVLPRPGDVYDASKSREINARIEDLIKTRLGQYEMPVYTGIPQLQLKGSNAAFQVPTGTTITVLPFNTTIVDNAELRTDPAVWGIKPKFDMNTQMFFRLRHNAASGGSVDMIAYFLANGTVVESYGFTARLDDVFDLSDVFFPIVPLGVAITIGLTHSHNSPVTVDMTKSKLAFFQLTPNPRYVDSGRYTP